MLCIDMKQVYRIYVGGVKAPCQNSFEKTLNLVYDNFYFIVFLCIFMRLTIVYRYNQFAMYNVYVFVCIIKG